MYRLQKQLIISYEARLLAVRRVITNPGRRTPGVDGVIWNTELELMNTVNLLRDLSKYQSKPVKRIYIPKPGKDEMRPLGIPTIFDRAVQALAYIALIPVAETRADTRSFGSRPYRSTKDAIQYLFFLLAAHKKKC
jgi:RNA-directed DNA polymerase